MANHFLSLGASALAALALTSVTPAWATEWALSFDGVNDVVTVDHAATLNPHPFTVTAWFKTDRNDAVSRQLIGKHTVNPTNGYALTLQNGRIHTRFGRSFSAGVGDLQSGVVADGTWHHVAFTVGPSGGRLYIDGLQVDSSAWGGTAGAPTDTATLQMGSATDSFAGQLDEVAVWSTNRSQASVQASMFTKLAGDEARLVACWHLDREVVETTASDATGNGHTGTLPNGPNWVSSSIPWGVPYVATLSVAGLSATNVTFRSTVCPNGQSTMQWFDFGTTTAYGNVTALQDAGSGTAVVTLNGAVTCLTPNTTYHVRAAAINSAGMNHGSDLTFTTPAPSTDATLAALSVSTGTLTPGFAPGTTGYTVTVPSSVTNVTVTPVSACLCASVRVQVNGGGFSIVPYGAPSSALPLALGNNTIDVQVTAQDPGTTLTYSITVIRADPPDVTTKAASGVTSQSATLHSSVNPNRLPTTTWFEWRRPFQSYHTTPAVSAGSGFLPVTMSRAISGLSPRTEYQFRAVAQNFLGTTNGLDSSFTTPPTITTCPASRTLAAGPDCQATLPDLTGEVVTPVGNSPPGELVITQSPAAGMVLGLGPTVVTFTATDALNIPATCQATVTVADQTPPVLTCPADLEVDTALGQCEATVDFTVTATDNCDPAPVVTCVPPSGTLLPVGRTNVVCTARDSSGNTASSTFPVTVYPTRLAPAGSIWTPAQAPSGLESRGRNWQSVASSADGTRLVATVYHGQIYTSADSGVTWTARESNRSWSSIASSADGTRLVATVYMHTPLDTGGIYTSTDSGATWTARESNRSWISVASSADGSKLVAAVTRGQIYTSTDSGATWTACESNRSWISVASSADGSKLVAAVYFGQIYTSTDSGATWTACESNRNWSSVASSSDGTRLVATMYSGQIYTSTDFGLTWTARMTDANRDWFTVASSSDGTRLVATMYSGQIYTSTDSGLTWTARESNRNWSSVASSADGSKLVAAVNPGQIYTSTDSGATWAERATGSDWEWRSVASSADGSKLVAAMYTGEICTSTDFGLTWTARMTGSDWGSWSVASSADGSKLVAAVSDSQIYTSTDSGLTWTARESNRSWSSIASSADGTRLVATLYSGQIYTSMDSGATWTLRVTGLNWEWSSVASSADGTSLVATVNHGPICTSKDYGATWTARMTDANRNWRSVASSADGRRLVAAVTDGQIYTSTDYGLTWTPRESDRDWRSVASSADGTRLIATVYLGQVYTSTDSGLTWTARESNRKWTCVASSADGTKLFAAVTGGKIYSSVETVVRQLEPPIILGATNQVFAATAPSGAVVSYSVIATNLCQPNVPVTCTPPSGSTFPVGTTTVTCVAPDVAGSTTSPYAATATFTVTVTAPFSPYITGLTVLGNGAFQFGFTDAPGAGFSVLATTNVALPLSDWIPLGSPLEGPAGVFQFTDPWATNYPQRYYRVRSP